MATNSAQRKPIGIHSTQQHSQRHDLTKSLCTSSPGYASTSHHNDYINAIPPSVRAGEFEPLFPNEDDDFLSDDADSILTDSVSNSRSPPPRPKHLGSLILIAIFDLITMTVCTLFLTHEGPWNESGQQNWNKVPWDLICFGIFRITVAL